MNKQLRLTTMCPHLNKEILGADPKEKRPVYCLDCNQLVGYEPPLDDELRLFDKLYWATAGENREFDASKVLKSISKGQFGGGYR